jgi:hypothetical protein
MSIIAPKFVMLDTATLGHVAAEPTAPFSKELFAILRTGEWFPYLTWHHLEELISHGNDDVFSSRVAFLSRLPHVAYLHLDGHEPTEPYWASAVDLRAYETRFLATHPGAAHQDVIDAVWPSIRGGFVSGEQFVEANRQWWDVYRRDYAEARQLRKEQVANLTHFSPTDSKEPIPPEGQHETFLSNEASASLRKRMAANLAANITQSGHLRRLNATALADDFAAAVFDMSSQLRSAGPCITDAWLHQIGVSRDRLPPSPTVEDVRYEVGFLQQMRVITDSFSASEAQSAVRLRKDQIPSWVVWEQVDRRMKQLPRAEIGNVNDKHIVGFGLYVDVLNVDKRVAECLRQAAGHHALILQVYRRVPVERGLAGLIARLKSSS